MGRTGGKSRGSLKPWLLAAAMALLIIDGIIDIERTRERFPDRADHFFMRPDAIADSVYALTQQDRSAWAFEIDLRPYGEKW